jgi:hypothetical protein
VEFVSPSVPGRRARMREPLPDEEGDPAAHFAMQKVVGSSPIARSEEWPGNRPFPQREGPLGGGPVS